MCHLCLWRTIFHAFTTLCIIASVSRNKWVTAQKFLSCISHFIVPTLLLKTGSTLTPIILVLPYRNALGHFRYDTSYSCCI